MDVLDPATRARNMSAIRSRDTKAEMVVRRGLHRAGFRFRLHRRDLSGRPDLVFPGFRVALFVHGCFWHAHSCYDGHIPKTNASYWGPKIARNIERDGNNRRALEEAGWEVWEVYECEAKRLLPDLISRLTDKRAQLMQACGRGEEMF